jgi:hypothetical protein
MCSSARSTSDPPTESTRHMAQIIYDDQHQWIFAFFHSEHSNNNNKKNKMHHQRREQADKFDEKLQANKTRKRVADRPKTKISGEIGQRTCKKCKLGQETKKIQANKTRIADYENFGRNWTKDLQKSKSGSSKLGQEREKLQANKTRKRVADRPITIISGEIGQRTLAIWGNESGIDGEIGPKQQIKNGAKTFTLSYCSRRRK